MLAIVLSCAIGYAVGSLPWGLWIGRGFRGVDVRTLGSGNLGATNVFRSFGRGLGILTLVLDVLKGAVPVWLVPLAPFARDFPGGPGACAITVGLSAIAGHIWTFLAGFRGGKGVATTAGVLLALSPPAFAAFIVVFVATVAIARFISLGSILGAIAFAITLALLAPHGLASPTAWFGILVAALVVFRHKDNIRRLMRGEERRFEWKSDGEPIARESR